MNKTQIASYSLKHPTLPNVQVRVIQYADESFLIEETLDGRHTNTHYFPEIKTKRAICAEARQILRERREAAL